jgi:hypothetical protein
MRLSELCHLKVADLHLDEGYAKVYGKGEKEHPARVGSYSAKVLRFYLLHWRKPARPTLDTVFLTCRGVTRSVGTLAPEPGEQLNPKAVELMLKRVGRAAGVPRRHPHLLRHTFSCHYLIAYRDRFALTSLLGHTTLAMTNHYVAAVQQMAIVKADSASVLDAMDLRALWGNRRGRLPTQPRRKAASDPWQSPIRATRCYAALPPALRANVASRASNATDALELAAGRCAVTSRMKPRAPRIGVTNSISSKPQATGCAGRQLKQATVASAWRR